MNERRCMAPVGPVTADLLDQRLCGEPALETRIVGGLEWTLCREHVAEIDAEPDDSEA